MQDYQDWTVETAVYPEAGKYTERELNYLVHGLTGEAGELANKFKKFLRRGAIILREDASLDLLPEEAEMLIDEMGDILWYLCRMAETLGIPIEDIANRNRRKLEERKAADEIKSHS